MRRHSAIAVLFLLGLLPQGGQPAENEPAAGDPPAAEKEAAPDPQYPVVDLQEHTRPVCLYTGSLPPEKYQYVVVRKIRVMKKAAGPTDALYPGIGDTARRAGGDWIIDLKVTKRVSPVVWRIVAPVVDGVMIKFIGDAPRPDCKELGGLLY